MSEEGTTPVISGMFLENLVLLSRSPWCNAGCAGPNRKGARYSMKACVHNVHIVQAPISSKQSPQFAAYGQLFFTFVSDWMLRKGTRCFSRRVHMVRGLTSAEPELCQNNLAAPVEQVLTRTYLSESYERLVSCKVIFLASEASLVATAHINLASSRMRCIVSF